MLVSLASVLLACGANDGNDGNPAAGGESDRGAGAGGTAAFAGAQGGDRAASAGASDIAAGAAGTSSAGGTGNAGNAGNAGAPAGPSASVGAIATVGAKLPLLPAPGTAGPALKVDLDMLGRPTSEVSESGHVSWPVTTSNSLVNTFQGVQFTFAKAGSNGSGLTAGWQKAAVQSPNYARLVGDGLTVADGDAGAQVQLTIKGLPAGKHTLLSYHNIAAGSAPGSSLDVLVNGSTQVSKLSQSVGALSNTTTPSAYLQFSAETGKDVVILYRATKNLMINGFELDLPNVTGQAIEPLPEDNDEHVAANAGKLSVSWRGAQGATSHDVYFGTDPSAVAKATHASPEFKGNQPITSYALNDLNSIARYYWRIDELSGSTLTRGSTWYFRLRQVAFPGAEGYGRFAIGGRGGVVVHVTNLKDSGAGSLRDAIETDRGPRTVVFDVGGIIPLASRLTLSQPYVTVAGQTAPGKGILIRAAPFGVSGAHDVVLRHVRVRLGHGTTFDGMGLQGAEHAIVDHSSISWTIDEAFSSRNGKNLTLQRTFISEALNAAGHQNYPPGTEHGYAASIGGDVGSFHHNLLAHCEGRNWSLAGGLDPNGNFSGRLDIFNNVVYNWDGRTTDGGAHEVNFVNNYYRPGAASTIFTALNAQYDSFPGTQQYYMAGNVMPGYFDEASQAKGRRTSGNVPTSYSPWVSKAFFPSYAAIDSAKDAFKSVLSDVGATQPVFDEHDVRVRNETLNGTYKYKGSVTGKPGLPDTEADVGGYESFPNESRAASWDADGDGLPNWWESARKLRLDSPSNDRSDANVDSDGDGYTQLDEYLAWMALPHGFSSVGKAFTVDLSQAFAGYTNGPSYAATNATVTGKTLTFTPTKCGLASFTAQVTDKDGSTMSKTWGVSVSEGCP